MFIANSRNVQKRIKKYYGRESNVIYPPIDVANFKVADNAGAQVTTSYPSDKHGINLTRHIRPGKDYYLIGGRLVSYKRFDLAVKAFNKLGIPLKIFGIGPDEEKLKKMAKDNIEFLGQISDNKKAELYSQALGFIHPHEEDFGITAVEAMASGRPVIAYKKGGVMETVVDGETGVFFDEQEWEALADAVIRFEPERFDPVKIREHAVGFSKERFKKEMKDFVEKKWEEFNQL